MNTGIVINAASAADAAALLDIYSDYVRNTAISFEYEPPSLEEFSSRIEHVLEKFPYLAARRGDELLGYAYAKAFHERKAYSWVVEVSIYVSKDARGMGLGRRLYEELEKLLKKQGVLHLVACVADPKQEDEYLSHNSRDFHEHMGFKLYGEFKHCGYKFGRWYNMLWLSKQINEYAEPQSEVIPLRDI